MTNGTTTAGEAAEAASAPSLKSRVVSASVWTLVSFGGSQVLRLLSNIVLTWLLIPDDFGLMGLVYVFVQGLSMFSDVGIGPSIIQGKRGEEKVFLNTAWTVQVIRGAVIWIVAVLVARPYASFYGYPELAKLIPVASLSALIAGFQSTRFFTAGRRIALARVTVLEFIASTVGIVATVVTCYISRSLWAIVFGGLVASLTKTVLTFTMLEGERNAFAFEPEAFREMSRFGRWVFVSTSMLFLAGQVDRLLLGKFVAVAVLGVYNIANQLATLPPNLALGFTGNLLFPLFAHQARTDAKAFENALFTSRRVILEGAWFLFAGLALVAPPFFHTFYKPAYWDAIWISQLMTVPMWTWMLALSADRALLAVGDSRTLAISNGTSFLGKVAACFIGYEIGGLVGFILGLAVGNLCGHAPVVLALARRGTHLLKQDVPYTLSAVASIGSGVVLQHLLVAKTEGEWRRGIELAVALVILIPLGIRLFKHGRELLARK
jgi:O-antigen/teichoic acid export membrane protein